MTTFVLVSALIGFLAVGLLLGLGGEAAVYSIITALSFVTICREWFRKWEEPTLA
ncbi:MAG: hypothetical protein AAGL10_04620 [Pseudomonadota bacterium]